MLALNNGKKVFALLVQKYLLTSTKVQILTQLFAFAPALAAQCCKSKRTQSSCFTGTEVQILTAFFFLAQCWKSKRTQSSCFTGTEVQILTAEELRGRHEAPHAVFVLLY
jgi:hypothetical protein